MFVYKDYKVVFEKFLSGYRPIVIGKDETRKIFLYMQDKQVELYEVMLSKIKFKEDVSFDLFVMIVSGCAKYSIYYD
jgi:hypothetical protein